MAIVVNHSYGANASPDISSVVVDSGSGRVLMYVADVAAFGLPSAVSYGATSLSSFTAVSNWVGGRSFQVWYLLDPAVGTANITTSGTGPSAYYCANASTIDGVDTTSFATAFGTPNSATGSSTNPTVNIASGANELVYGIISSYVQTVTISAPSTELASAADANDPCRIKTLSNNSGNASETIQGTMTSAGWGIWGVALNPVSGGGGGNITSWITA